MELKVKTTPRSRGSRKSERWQALAAVLLPEGPKGPRVATLPLEGPRVSRPRPRRGRGRLKESDACQRYYMFFTVQPKISIFMAQFKYLNDVQNASKSPWTFIHAILTSCEKIREICRSGEKLQVVEILQKWGVCVKNGYDSRLPTRGHNFAKYDRSLKGHNFCSIVDRGFI